VGCTTATPAAAAAATPADDDDDTPASRPTSVVRSPTQAARPHGTARHGVYRRSAGSLASSSLSISAAALTR